jgi:hypothetical protein
MPTIEERLITLERQIKIVLTTTSAFQGQPADATLSIPHNDSWLFEDNVDATHPANLRYVISKNVTRVVSARLSIHLAPYRTYNSFSATTTQGESVIHTHPHSTPHTHTIPIGGMAHAADMSWAGAGTNLTAVLGPANTGPIQSVTPGTSDANTQDHTHLISVTSTLGVTEGATATGVTLAFDGVASGLGPYNADVIELDVRSLIKVTQGVYHTIAMQPSGLGRIEAHLRLGVYVSAGQVL